MEKAKVLDARAVGNMVSVGMLRSLPSGMKDMSTRINRISRYASDADTAA